MFSPSCLPRCPTGCRFQETGYHTAFPFPVTNAAASLKGAFNRNLLNRYLVYHDHYFYSECVCVCARTLVHMCAFSSGGHRLTSSAIPQELSSLFLETGSLSGTWGSPIVLGPQTSRIHLFPPPRTEIPSACTTPNFLCGFLLLA